MKQNQKSNQKLNSKLIFLGSLLILMSVAFIFTSGCVTDDSSSYTPPSAPPDIVLTPAPSNDPIIGGYTDFTNKDRRSAYPPPADDSSSYTPPAPTPTQPTNMAQVIAQQMANAESQGLTLETVPVPSSEQTTHN